MSGRSGSHLGVAALVVYWLVQAATLGISDDEAYYWVLSRSPALGYTYHPPMVAWLIRASDLLFGWLPLPRELIVRLPGVALSAAALLLALEWLREVTGRREIPASVTACVAVPGLAALSWMMVPDHSLIFGWMLCFVASWRIIARDKPRRRDLLMLGAGAAIGMLSKFSAILFCLSAAAALLLMTRRSRARAMSALAIGAVAAALPILVWNSRNHWAALVYQLGSRHAGGGWDLHRYGTFWVTQLLLAGSVGIAGAALLARRWRNGRRLEPAEKFLALWAAPAGVFLVQPAYSPFKPHWALVFWLPVALACALEQLRSGAWTLPARVHAAFLVLLLALGFGATQWPLTSLASRWWNGATPNPLWDVSNDLSGWSELCELLGRAGVPADAPIVGSRYQTAAQAAFAAWPGRVATLSPASEVEKKEWPALEDWIREEGPGRWPRLLRPVVYVSDDRYGEPPRFPNASCVPAGTIDSPRFGVARKGIHALFCSPR